MRELNLLDILVGLGIAALLRRRWYLIPFAAIAAALLFNGTFDQLNYGNLFQHPQEIMIDAMSFTVWGLAACFVLWFIRKVRQLDT
jgi:hypothetical protein